MIEESTGAGAGSETSPRTVTRRTAILGTAAAGAGIWAAPVLTSLSPRAFAGSVRNCSFPVKAGQTVTFSGLEINNACDNITLAYQYNGSSTVLANRVTGCGVATTYPDVSFIAPVDGEVVPYMEDMGDGAQGGASCDYIYLSSNSLHASCVGGGKSQTIYYVDSYFCTSDTHQPYPPGSPGPGNFNGSITVTIS